MGFEIEAKLKVESLDEVGRRLLHAGASFVDELVQFDRYFDYADGRLTKADSCIRLRRQSAATGCTMLLTYKGPKRTDRFKTRLEVETAVGDETATAALLSALGLGQRLSFLKKRKLWRILRCSVALDELPLVGSFVEIEGPDSARVAEVRDVLELGGYSHVPRSYASMVEDVVGSGGKGDDEA